jgi:hypothetical protein
MQLYISGAPDGLDSFPPGYPIESCLAELTIEHSLHGQWREIASRVDDRRLRRAIEYALWRGRSTLAKLLRRAKSRARRIFGRAMSAERVGS